MAGVTTESLSYSDELALNKLVASLCSTDNDPQGELSKFLRENPDYTLSILREGKTSLLMPVFETFNFFKEHKNTNIYKQIKILFTAFIKGINPHPDEVDIKLNIAIIEAIQSLLRKSIATYHESELEEPTAQYLKNIYTALLCQLTPANSADFIANAFLYYVYLNAYYLRIMPIATEEYGADDLIPLNIALQQKVLADLNDDEKSYLKFRLTPCAGMLSDPISTLGSSIIGYAATLATSIPFENPEISLPEYCHGLLRQCELLLESKYNKHLIRKHFERIFNQKYDSLDSEQKLELTKWYISEVFKASSPLCKLMTSFDSQYKPTRYQISVQNGDGKTKLMSAAKTHVDIMAKILAAPASTAAIDPPVKFNRRSSNSDHLATNPSRQIRTFSSSISIDESRVSDISPVMKAMTTSSASFTPTIAQMGNPKKWWARSEFWIGVGIVAAATLAIGAVIATGGLALPVIAGSIAITATVMGTCSALATVTAGVAALKIKSVKDQKIAQQKWATLFKTSSSIHPTTDLSCKMQKAG